jgi:hypothetical protein
MRNMPHAISILINPNTGIVAVIAGDPVRHGMEASYAGPGGS